MLEDRGVIRTAGRRGTFVRDDALHEVNRATSQQAERAMRDTVSSLLGTGLTPARISTLFNDVLSQVKA